MYDICRELCPYCRISFLPATTHLPKHHTTRKHTSNSPPIPSLPPPPPPLPPPPLLPQKLMFTGKASDDDSSKDEDVHVPDYEALAQDIQNWASRHVRTETMGVRHFRKFFGTSVLVMKKVGIWLTGTPSPPEKTTGSICFGASIL